MPASLSYIMTPPPPQVKTMYDTEKMSSSDQIARLFRPGAKYFNMNPFEVLGLPHTATVDDVKRAYRRMSVQVRARLPLSARSMAGLVSGRGMH
jgi:DnaJ family protein C protein 8